MLWPEMCQVGDLETERAALTLLEELLAQPAADREGLLRTRTHGNRELRARVATLLRIDSAAMNTGAAMDVLEDDKPLERIGAYRIAGLIGRGGMG